MCALPMRNNGVSKELPLLVIVGLKASWPVIAIIITTFLFLLMAFLITPQGEVPQTVSDDVTITIKRPERDERVVERDRQRNKKPVLDKTPPPPKVLQTKPRSVANEDAITVTTPEFRQGDNTFSVSTDRRATPIVRIPPQYPQSPLARGIEGWVLVEFTITSTGTVADARVIDAEPEKIFNRATLNAIKRWKYQPKIENGKAVPQYNMRDIFRYEIEK